MDVEGSMFGYFKAIDDFNDWHMTLLMPMI